MNPTSTNPQLNPIISESVNPIMSESVNPIMSESINPELANPSSESVNPSPRFRNLVLHAGG